MSPDARAIERGLWPRALACLGLSIAIPGVLVGCVTISKHEELRNTVVKLEAESNERSKLLEEAITRADEQLTVLQEHVKQAEEVLRSSQAGTGVRVENMEADLADLRGMAEETRIEVDAVKRSGQELRTDLDERVNRLEVKLNAATDIPEGKTALFNAAEKALDNKQYAQSRRLFRTFMARYSNDKRGPEIRFKIGLTLYNEGDYASALGEFHWIKKNAPRSKVLFDALYYLGLSFAKTGQCKNAIAYFQFLTKRSSKAPKRYRDRAKKQIQLLNGSAADLCQDNARAARTSPVFQQ